MKNVFFIIILAAGIIAFIKYQDQIIEYVTNKAGGATPERKNTVAAIKDINKNVRLKKGMELSWEIAKNEERLAFLDSISTGSQSEALIKFDNSYYFKVSENSLIVIEDPGTQAQNIIELTLDDGTLQAKNTESSGLIVKIKTTDAIAEVSGLASFGIRADKLGKNTEVWVEQGLAKVKDAKGEETILRANEHKQFSSQAQAVPKYIVKEYVIKEGEKQPVDITAQSTEYGQALSRRKVNEIIRKQQRKIETCYQKVGIKKAVNARMQVRVLIENTGRVSSVNILESTVANTEVENCVVFWLKGMHFPSFKGKAIEEQVPIIFN